jgi:uncharacterized RDD family membrane protein YckC
METLETPGTQMEFERAPDGDRIIAFLIDGFIICGLSYVPIIGWLAGMAYGLLKDGLPFLDGQSVGKKVMKIRAVSEYGEDLTNNWGPAVIRNAVFFIPFFVIVELIVMLTNQDRLRLGDQWAKTQVIKEVA